MIIYGRAKAHEWIILKYVLTTWLGLINATRIKPKIVLPLVRPLPGLKISNWEKSRERKGGQGKLSKDFYLARLGRDGTNSAHEKIGLTD